MNTSKEMIVLGIDPGTTIMGYGVVQVLGNTMNVLSLGSIHLTKYSSQPLKLKKIYESVSRLAEEYKPDICSIEAPFYGKNVQSMLKLGRAQGVCMSAVIMRDIPIVEYSPKKIKQSITGNGNASKEQVAKMLQTICKMTRTPKTLDATDGLAAAVCHVFQKNSFSNASYGGWKGFIKENKDRVTGN